MPILHVRNIPDDLYQRLKARAQKEKRSLSAEVTILLDQALRSYDVTTQADLLDTIQRRRFFRPDALDAPDSLSLLRKDRTR